MKHFLTAALLAAATLTAATSAQAAPTIKLLVVQEDWDAESLPRDSRVQSAVLTTFNTVLNAPTYRSHLSRHGIDGMEVYDETSVTLEFYGQDRRRRSHAELVSLARAVTNPGLDVVVPYTLYARAVDNPYTGAKTLQMSLSYRALSVRDGRYLAGDRIALDTSGLPFTGCAASLAGTAGDPHCVKAFMAQHGSRLARSAGDKLALQLAAYLGDAAPRQAPAAAPQANTVTTPTPAPVAVADGCDNLPVTYQMTFRGFDAKQINAIEQTVSFWNCVMDSDVTDSGFSEITFSYKTRADQQRLLRNIRLMSETMGLLTDARSTGSNGIVVESVSLRSN